MKAISTVLTVMSMILSNTSLMAQTKINISVNGHTLTATLENNSSAKALAELLENGSITIDAHEYGGFEMVGPLPSSLQRNDRQITTKPGDIILYTGSNICFYYGVNSWNFTRLGTVDNAGSHDLKTVYGAESGNARFVLSLADNSDINDVATSGEAEIVAIHEANGRKIAHNNPGLLEKGIYIITLRNPDGTEQTIKKNIVR